MERLSIDQIIKKIENEEIFDAVSEEYGFTLKVDVYCPYICAAIHDGNQFRKELWNNCKHTAYERWYEEDPNTKQMIQSQPIVIAGMDSRFEYDLNRAPESAIYDDAWGKQLWYEPLSDLMKEKSLSKHRNFYKVVHALVSKIETMFNCCIVFDMHSYNWQRWDREVPAWNLGTSNVDQEKFGNAINSWREALDDLELPNGINNEAKINDTFQGNGYFLKFISQEFNNTLVLATEVKKIYCNEMDGVIYPEVVKSIENYLNKIIPLHAKSFENQFAK